MSIEIRNMNKAFNSLQIIVDFHYTFLESKVYCLFGPSGCGKTTLLHVIAGILPFDSGLIMGLENKKIAVVFQEDRLLPWFTAAENVKFVTDGPPLSIEKYLEIVGLEKFAHYYPQQLSGGMKRRVAIARALAFNGDLLLMDEPFKGIDEKIRGKIMEAILAEKDKRQIIIFSTHNKEEAGYMADEILYFNTVIKNR